MQASVVLLWATIRLDPPIADVPFGLGIAQPTVSFPCARTRRYVERRPRDMELDARGFGVPGTTRVAKKSRKVTFARPVVPADPGAHFAVFIA